MKVKKTPRETSSKERFKPDYKLASRPRELSHRPAPLNHKDILGDLNSSLEAFDGSWMADGSSGSGSKRGKKSESSPSKYDASLDVTSRKGRTAVYAGTARAACYDYVPSLEELCLSVLKNNIHMITTLGLAPYHLIKPVLSKCSWQELKRIESYNESFLEDTDELWKTHCEIEFHVTDLKGARNWRKKFFKELEKRENKLKKITKDIKKKAREEAEPVKKTVTINAIAATKGRSKMLPLVKESVVSKSSSTASAMKATAMQNRVAAAKQPPKKAPLMAKTIQMFKQRYRGSR